MVNGFVVLVGRSLVGAGNLASLLVGGSGPVHDALVIGWQRYVVQG
jgi:hypothetical protein